MFQNERYREIYEILEEQDSATIQYLQKRLFVSEATIRRDLQAMEQAGMIVRLWGGAMRATSKEKDIPPFVRAKTNNDKKAKIARTASALLRENSSIFFASSTTSHHMVPYLARFKSLTLITSTLEMQALCSEKTNANVHLLGGCVSDKNIMTGHVAIASVRHYHADMMFFSCSGVSTQSGFTSVDAKVVEVCKEMMAHSDKKIMLCDSSKVGSNALWHLADIDEVDYIIMDQEPDDPELVRAMGSRLITDKSQLK